MKDEIRVELIKVAAQLAQTTVQNKVAFGELDRGAYIDLEAVFLRCLKSVKAQFNA